MKLLSTLFIAVGLLLFLPVITIPWGLGFIAIGALLRIAARKETPQPISITAPDPALNLPASYDPQFKGWTGSPTVAAIVIMAIAIGAIALVVTSLDHKLSSKDSSPTPAKSPQHVTRKLASRQ